MGDEENKLAILEALKKKKGKTKFYIKDFYKILPEEKPRYVKNIINKMVQEQTLEYWSSGSTTLYGLKGVGKQHTEEAEEED
jgi:hypothetical protein